jgi:diguanylate cyclase (GGDEF)-like protein
MNWPGTARRGAGRADPLLTFLILAAVVVPPLYALFGGGDERGPALTVFWIAMAVIHGGYAVLTRQIAVRRRGAGRRLWGLLAAAAAVWTVGDIYQVAYGFDRPVGPDTYLGTTVQAVCLLAGMLLALGGLLSHPCGQRSGLRMDVATVMAGAITAGILLIQLPSGVRDTHWMIDLVVTLLCQPGVFLLAVFAVARITLIGRSPVTRTVALLNGLAATLQAVLQAFPAEAYGQPRTGALLCAASVLASMLLLIGGRVQHRVGAAGGERPVRPYSLLPYGAMAVTWAAGVGVLMVEGLTWRSWLVIGGAMVTTGLVVARQAAAFRHIAELLSERDALAARLTEQAFHDALTGLANRALFLRSLSELLPGTPVTVFLIDLDDFKPVNDRYGHATGDRLLIEVGGRLRRCVRAGDTVARLGGDEFAVLMADLAPARRAEVAAALNAELTGLVTLGEVEVPLRASVGMATGHCDPDSLLHEADMAMYAVKNAARTASR